MNCNQVRMLAPRFMQSVLAHRENAAVEAHLNDCARCRAAFESITDEPVLDRYALCFAAPAELRERVVRALDGVASNGARTPRTSSMRRFRVPEWLKLGMVSVATAMAVTAAVLPVRTDFANGSIADVLIASHVRWNRVGRLTDVATSDRHTVKPWLSKALGFSPAVPDLTASGFSLVGARIEYLHDRFVGTIVYKRREHVIDVYAWPGAPPKGRGHTLSRNGFHVLVWTVGGIAYWAVSDLDIDELMQFANLCARST